MSYIMDTEEHRYDMQCEMCSPVVVGGSCSDLCADNLICPHQSPVTILHLDIPTTISASTGS